MRHGFSVFAILFITLIALIGPSYAYATEEVSVDAWEITDTIDARLYRSKTENKYDLVIDGDGAVTDYASLDYESERLGVLAGYKSSIISIRLGEGITLVSRGFLEELTAIRSMRIDGVDIILPANSDGLFSGTVSIASHMNNTSARAFAESLGSPFSAICEYESSVCSVCGYTCQHSDGRSEATCTAGSLCNTCNTVVSPPIEHSYTLNNGVSANCEAGGTVSHYECDVCHALFDLEKNPITDVSTAPAGHSYGELVSGFSPSCTVAGQIDYYECSVCHARFDLDKNKVLSIYIPLLSHKGGTATCTDKARCEVCNTPYGELNPDSHTLYYEYDSSGHRQACQCGYTLDKVSHTFFDEVVSPPTETVEGILRSSCECGYYTDSAIPPLDNTKDNKGNDGFNFPLFFGILIPSVIILSVGAIVLFKFKKHKNH